MSTPADDQQSRRFTGTWRRYQQVVLDAFDRDRAAGDNRFYAVLPPGAGKTLIGLEAARRIGRRTLVLTPNTAVQGQWAATSERMFPGGPCGTDRDLATTVNVLTYQSIAVLDRGLTAAQRRAVLRDGDREALLDLLHPNGRAVIDLAAGTGPWTLVLDECHHLLATWGALVRAIVDTLGADTALIGLTATPPHELTGWQRTLQTELFGGTDIEIPAPALVKEGELAPYQELVYLTAPTVDEDTWLAAQTSRFADLQVQLVDKQLGTIPLLEWLDRRAGRRTEDGPPVGWATFEQGEPDLARAALRFAHAGLIELPDGARVREQHRAAPDAQDWVAVLSDFCQGHLRDSDDPDDAEALAAIKRVLPGLGYRLTAQGLRATTSPVDRLCGLSEAKIAAAVHILDTERAVLGAGLRALVLCDFEQQPARALGGLDAPLDDQAGSARLVFRTLATTDFLRPLLVTGQTFACPAGLADDLVAFCRAAGQLVTTEPFSGGVRIVGVSSSAWVPIATDFFARGHADVLVGTRSLLGEGWDCPCVNVTVDLTTAATATAITQMRGRSLRPDASSPDKLADNWTVCCVTADHPRGDADYRRLVRKHDAYFALSAQGEVESGISHCDPLLSPFSPPVDPLAVTSSALGRVGSRADVRSAWGIGLPFAGVEMATVRVRAERSFGVSARGLPSSVLVPVLPGGHVSRRRPVVVGSGAVAFAGSVAAAGSVSAVVGAGVGVLGVGAVLGRVVRDSGRLGSSPSALDQLAAVVADALHGAGGVSVGASSVRVSASSDGWLRCSLEGVSVSESRLFTSSLDELISPLAEPRHLVGRRVVSAPSSWLGRVSLAFRSVVGLSVSGSVAWHAVPSWCAFNARRLSVFLEAWERFVGPARHVSAESAEGFAVLSLYRGADPFSVSSQMRTLWR